MWGAQGGQAGGGRPRGCAGPRAGEGAGHPRGIPAATSWRCCVAGCGCSGLTGRIWGCRFQQDLAHIKAGHYKMPWDMTTLTHRQYNPLYAAAK